MSSLALLVVALAAAFAVALVLRNQGEVDELLRQLKMVQAKLAATEADLSTLQRRLETTRMELSALQPESPAPRPRPTNGTGADPRVYVQRVPDQPHDRVILSNRSAVTARDLTLDLRGPGGVTPFLPEFAERNFPVEMLQQGVPYIVLASFRGQCWPPLDARLEWRDPDGSRQVRAFKLNF